MHFFLYSLDGKWSLVTSKISFIFRHFSDFLFYHISSRVVLICLCLSASILALHMQTLQTPATVSFPLWTFLNWCIVRLVGSSSMKVTNCLGLAGTKILFYILSVSHGPKLIRIWHQDFLPILQGHSLPKWQLKIQVDVIIKLFISSMEGLHNETFVIRTSK